MKNGVFATALFLIAASQFASAQDVNRASAPCACKEPPRLFPGLFNRRQPVTRVEPPLFANPQPVANAGLKTNQPQKVTPAYLPPSIPTAPSVPTAPPVANASSNRPTIINSRPTSPEVTRTAQATPARPNYDHLLDVSGHDRNYSWITGVLRKKAGMSNVWFIHYVPSDAMADMHGGVLPIQTRAPIDGFREGDLVTVIGYIITNADVAPNQRMTAFAADQVNKVK